VTSQPDVVGNLFVERSAGNLHATFVRGDGGSALRASSYQLELDYRLRGHDEQGGAGLVVILVGKNTVNRRVRLR
jgi:hypothetical protein